jgi:hypothetical protein
MSVLKYKDPVTGEWKTAASVKLVEKTGGTSIDVTAEVGQTIVVEEVDNNGKPTKWKAVEHQPRTHWSEVGTGDILPETGFTPTYNSMLGCYTALIPSFKLEVGKTYTVIFDGVEYTLTAFAGTVPFNFIAVGNTVFAGGENTGEPFAVAYLTDMNECDVLCMDAEQHTVQVIGDITVYNQIPMEYVTNAFPYYVKATADYESGLGGKLSNFSCNETVVNLSTIYNSGRGIILRLMLQDTNPNNADIVEEWDYQFAGAMTDRSRSKYVFYFTRALLDSTDVLYLIPQEDGTYILNNSLGN